MDSTITLADQVACVEREIAMRRAVYPGLVARERMSQAKADREIAAMEAVLETLGTQLSQMVETVKEAPTLFDGCRGDVPAAAHHVCDGL